MIDLHKYKALSFDCYGTLIDWEGGLTKAASPWLDAASTKISPHEFIEAFGSTERGIQQASPGALYPKILEEVLRKIGTDRGIAVDDQSAKTFGSSVPDWPAFEDSTDALRALARQYKLIVLSNVDRTSFEGSRACLGVEFDRVITAEEVGSYKPDLRNFEVLVEESEKIGVAKHELLHVAESMNHDVVPAYKVGIDVVWIDRAASEHHPRASGRLPDGTDFLERYTSMAAFAVAAGCSAECA